MRFEDLNWFDIENYLQHDNRLMLVTGACEQHAYLSLLTDVKIPLALADAASQSTGVPVAPTLNFGCSPYFLAYPGTLSLRVATLLDVVEDLLRSAYTQGFRRFLFLNGHGGNDPIRSRIYELLNQFEKMQVHWYSWWNSHSVEAIAHQHNLKPTHANWLEAFPFTRVADLPEGTKIPPSIPGLVNAENSRLIFGDGSFGGVYQADQKLMDEIFQAALMDVLQLLKFDDR
ncbi:MAG TPA: creatininase family protein [Anaerolineales bacterium]|nr:creatininase family protein [Anaerolineales bacterium]